MASEKGGPGRPSKLDRARDTLALRIDATVHPMLEEEAARQSLEVERITGQKNAVSRYSLAQSILETSRGAARWAEVLKRDGR